MKILGKAEYAEVHGWIYRNARPLDLARWQYHFENGGKDAVLSALAAYQNPDGGFGLGLEADNWNPNSSPFTTGTAVDVLKEIGSGDARHPIAQGILRFLGSGAHFTGSDWPFTIPTNSDHPHAPWWTYSEETNAEYGFFATTPLAGFILRMADKSSALYQTALSIAGAMFEKARSLNLKDVHELQGYCTLLEDVRSAGLAGRFDCAALEAALKPLIDASIVRDPAQWPVYSMRPSMYVRSADAFCYPGNEDIVEKELEYIVDSRKPGGVWAIMWRWADYPNEFAVAENWWQANWAIRNLLFLRAFGRI